MKQSVICFIVTIALVFCTACGTIGYIADAVPPEYETPSPNCNTVEEFTGWEDVDLTAATSLNYAAGTEDESETAKVTDAPATEPLTAADTEAATTVSPTTATKPPATEVTAGTQPAVTEAATEAPNSTTAQHKYILELLNLINEARAAEGLDALVLDEALNEAAMVVAKEITVSFTHKRPNGSSAFSILAEKDIQYGIAAENIARGFDTPNQVFDAWMGSEKHRKNILNPAFARMGAAYYVFDDEYEIYWAQFFTD